MYTDSAPAEVALEFLPETPANLTPTIRRAQRGDRGAFEAVYREHVSRVYALCLRICADAARAEELTQDVFVRTWQMLGSFRGDSAFSSWLHRLPTNRCSRHR